MPESPTGLPTHTRSTSGRLWQLLPVDWGKVQEVTNEPVPGHIKRWWFALGGTPAYLFFIQLTTGILLTFYYVPSADHAFESVARITEHVPYGWFVRSVHKWAANLMVITVLLHMSRVFFSAGFRHPRQVNWVIGCGLLLCTVVLGFTGYSLIYEQLSYWGITVATELTELAPVVGEPLAYFMRGGTAVGPNTLTRMYNLHVSILPVAMIALIGLHIAVLRLHGVSELSFEDAPSGADESGPAPAARLLGVRLLALTIAVLSLVCVGMAALNPGPVALIAHELTPEAGRVFWLILGIVGVTTSALLFKGHLYGLFLWLCIGILAVAKLLFDISQGESRMLPLWIGAATFIGMTVVYGAVRHGRFREVHGPDKPFNFFPDHLITELMIGTLLLFLLTLLSLVFPAEMGIKADPLHTPEHIKPEWYFFFQFRMLKLMGLNAAVIVTGLLGLVVLLWPWVDAILERIAPKRDIGVYVGIVAFTAFLVLTVWEAAV